ncbi:hypothetical protein WY02_03395 [Pseudonocardia sp. AL041005-10]|nr:hypothetical protein [Pseudonocardia sp. AL041005-10]ALE77650.1 hypothetical protein WY02_03395 [Pseudonocardia sp. AL041005-10]
MTTAEPDTAGPPAAAGPLDTPEAILAEMERISSARMSETVPRSGEQRARWLAQAAARCEREAQCWQAALDLALGDAELPRRLVLYALVDARGSRDDAAIRYRSQLAPEP